MDRNLLRDAGKMSAGFFSAPRLSREQLFFIQRRDFFLDVSVRFVEIAALIYDVYFELIIALSINNRHFLSLTTHSFEISRWSNLAVVGIDRAIGSGEMYVDLRKGGRGGEGAVLYCGVFMKNKSFR